MSPCLRSAGEDEQGAGEAGGAGALYPGLLPGDEGDLDRGAGADGTESKAAVLPGFERLRDMITLCR